jgi:regulator of protease activity HflC (stomatin/prohibitin superfamily)
MDKGKDSSTKSDKFGQLLLRHRIGVIVLVFIVLLTLLSFVNVPAGHKAVVVSAPSSGFIGTTLGEGWHFNPYFILCDVEIIRYNIQTVEFSVLASEGVMSHYGPVNVRSQDNLEVYLDFAITYHIPEDYVSYLRVNYGDYKSTILIQVARSVPRDVCSQYPALELAGPLRPLVEDSIADNITAQLGAHHIVVNEFNLREIQLPDDVDSAVQRKKVAEQELITAGYLANRTVVLAQGQAQAMVINATGFANATVIKANGSAEAVKLIMDMLMIEDSNTTVEDYLTYLYMMALMDPNSNVQFVIVPSEGVPIIIQPTP